MRAFFQDIGGGKVDGDVFGGKRQTQREKGGAEALAALSGKPTRLNFGIPDDICTCTSMSRTFVPSKATVVTRAIIKKRRY